MTIGTNQNICIGFYDSEGLTQPLCFVYPCVFPCPHGFESLLFSYENKKTSQWMSFCFVDDDLFEPPWLRLNFLWQVVELAFSINKVHKKSFHYSIFLYILLYCTKCFNRFCRIFFLNFFTKIQLQYLRIFHHNYIHQQLYPCNQKALDTKLSHLLFP